jgi:hypothetical protein
LQAGEGDDDLCDVTPDDELPMPLLHSEVHAPPSTSARDVSPFVQAKPSLQEYDSSVLDVSFDVAVVSF